MGKKSNLCLIETHSHMVDNRYKVSPNVNKTMKTSLRTCSSKVREAKKNLRNMRKAIDEMNTLGPISRLIAKLFEKIYVRVEKFVNEKEQEYLDAKRTVRNTMIIR